MHSFNVVIRHTRLTRTPAFTQASSSHKPSVPPCYIIVWHVFLNHARNSSCTEITVLDTSKRCAQQTSSWKLAPRPCRKHEKRTAAVHEKLGTVPTADSVCCARVGREMNFLLTFKIAPFFCVCRVLVLIIR
jgi:hypothetical protein